MTEAQKIAHLHRRAGFGLNIRESASGKLTDHIEKVLSSNKTYNSLFLPGEEKVTTGELLAMDKEERKEILQDLAANIKRLNLEWLKEMGKAEGQLREKMSLFWHGHFAVRVRGYSQVEQYINTIRKYALANFGDLLMAVSKEPAMLKFLNNQQNRKNSPNENFAREVMELFTLGRGNYTENDIKESARAFTGWNFDEEDEFEMRTNQHDYGVKTIFGKTGNWEGEDVIKMILEKKETALFVTRKIYKFLVNENVDEQRISVLANRFYDAKYDIPTLLREIFQSDWFYQEKNVGSLIKSPIELIVGLNRTFGISYSNAQPLLAVQRVLGQTLFFPPNVAGWAGGRNWIDNSTLLTRLSLPKKLAEADQLDYAVKNNMDDENPNESSKPNPKYKLECNINWELFAKKFDSIPKEDQWNVLQHHLLASTNLIKMPEKLMSKLEGKIQLERIKLMSIYITRTPEYQLA